MDMTVQNPRSITIEGTEYRLRWDMNAMAAVEQLTGSNVLVGTMISASNVSAMIFAMIEAQAFYEEREAAPITLRQLRTAMATDEQIQDALDAVARMVPSLTATPDPNALADDAAAAEGAPVPDTEEPADVPAV